MTEIYGRDTEARAIIRNLRAKHSTLIIGSSGVGKTALIQWVFPLIEEEAKPIHVSRIGPGFSTALKEIYEGCLDHGWTDQSWKEWTKGRKSNDDKGKALCEILAKHPETVLMVDDCNALTAGNRPWMESFEELCVIIACIEPKSLQRVGSKRFWRRFDELQLEPLDKEASREMCDHLVSQYNIHADDMEAYKVKVLTLAQGIPFEIDRLIKYHSAESLVKVADLNEHADRRVDRETKQLALAPFFVLGLVLLAGARYAARARSDTDLLVISGFAMVFLIVMSPWLRKALKPRSA